MIMAEKQEIANLKQQIKSAIYGNSDRGFIPCGCDFNLDSGPVFQYNYR